MIEKKFFLKISVLFWLDELKSFNLGKNLD